MDEQIIYENVQPSPKKMRVAVVVSHPIQHFCPQYASWMKIEEIELKVFFGSNLGAVKYFDPGFGKEINWHNLYLDEFDHEFLNGDKTVQPDKNLSAINLDDRLDSFKPGLVVHYGYFQKLSRQAKSWALKNKAKIAYISDAELRQKRPVWKQFSKFPFLFLHFKNVNYFFTVGDANEAFYKFYAVPAKKLKRMHFPIDVKAYDIAFGNKTAMRNSFRARYNINNQDIVISVAGKLVEWKSQDHLIRLLKDMEVSSPSVKIHLLIAGSGPMEKIWKAKAEQLKHNQTHFLGFVNPVDLPLIYAATDVYIHPAFIEPHSLSVSEAIYMGCPVIVADTTGSWGVTDDVQAGKNGFVYRHGNLQQLAFFLKRIIQENLFSEFSIYSFKISRQFQYRSHMEILKTL